jgi:uncharacterized protein
MEPENQPLSNPLLPENNPGSALTPQPAELSPAEEPQRGVRWVFIGPQGLRAGWSVLLFLIFFIALNVGIDYAFLHAHLISRTDQFAPKSAFWGEFGGFVAMLISAALVALIERRRLLDYNLIGPRRTQNFFAGLAIGFLALSVLIAALAAGGWLHSGHSAITGAAVFRYALFWGCVFLVVGCVEEGLMRCYLLFTLTRGINFWWALGIVALLCGDLAIRAHGIHGSGLWGVYIAALLGLIPCFILHQNRAPGSGFWCAAWVTSTLFGFGHVANPGEAGIGVFAAAFIGFVFCVSVRVTGSAWWAIGCHAGWDWGETYFYGTADSGLTPHGSFLVSTPAGNPLWSGGAVGPEGSLLVVGVVLLILAVVLVYGRFSAPPQIAPAAAQAAD